MRTQAGAGAVRSAAPAPRELQYLCPGCGRQHGIEVAEAGAPPLEDVRLAEGA